VSLRRWFGFGKVLLLPFLPVSSTLLSLFLILGIHEHFMRAQIEGAGFTLALDEISAE